MFDKISKGIAQGIIYLGLLLPVWVAADPNSALPLIGGVYGMISLLCIMLLVSFMFGRKIYIMAHSFEYSVLYFFKFFLYCLLTVPLVVVMAYTVRIIFMLT